MIEGSVGTPWRADGHVGEVQFLKRMGGDFGGNGVFLPLLVRLANQNSSANEPKKSNNKP